LQPGQSIVYTITMQIPTTLTGDFGKHRNRVNSLVLINIAANNTATDTIA
jgi:hypothetical protein